ncbi:hypothetical protein HaLaN_14466 [Haematococcus lacustris]|uniref:Uncharacterized protein n=1 Tax=Haematococcus lacustris TaxID=44745 RepID=A0A699ZEI5_HAELA|nr:hypothetical protein HaLaN_14466 [Haematococcus lacustris]
MSSAPNMGLVICMQFLARYCTVFDSVYHIGIAGLVRVWGGGGLSATSLQPLSDPTAAADAHAHVEQPKRRVRSQR